MNCINCGTFLTDPDLEYCPRCGFNVLIQKKVDYLSKYYYNQGLEKASIRDLSGAITCLKQSLTYNKGNIDARNLLGLVYFETGEVVAALSEWVISKNLRPSKNLASEYINKLQANPNKLDSINETIKKYNHALILCREGHEDMAAIQLKKILTQNSKLIKGYHLLALIRMKEQEWNRARRILKKAAKIDKTNTTTLRFLREIDEQTGVATRLEKREKGFFWNNGDGKAAIDSEEGASTITPPSFKEKSRISLFFTLILGFIAGAAAFWFLAVPAIKQGIYKEANQQIVNYSESVASQGVELSKAQGEAKESGDAADAVVQQIEEEKKVSQSYQALFNAYYNMINENLDGAALEIQKVYADVLDDTARGIYSTICDTTGVTGIETSSSEDTEGQDTENNTDTVNGESTDTDAAENGYDSTDYDSTSYDDSYDDTAYDTYDYEDSSYGEDSNYYGGDGYEDNGGYGYEDGSDSYVSDYDTYY